MARCSLKLDAESLQVVPRRQGRDYLDVAGVARARIEMDYPRRFYPRPCNYLLYQIHCYLSLSFPNVFIGNPLDSRFRGNDVSSPKKNYQAGYRGQYVDHRYGD